MNKPAQNAMPNLALLPVAPHRLLFFAGMIALLLGMGWWTAHLVGLRWPGIIPINTAPVPAGWGHAILMQYLVFTPFIFGFLLTVFPRWLGQPALAVRRYLPIGIGLALAYVLTTLGLAGHGRLLHAGVVLGLLAWLFGIYQLLRVQLAPGPNVIHAQSALFALCLGWCGLLLFAVYLHHPDARLIYASIKIGGFGFLLPIFFSVCHRMLPFFARCVLPDYVEYRPNWVVPAIWAGLLLHLGFELAHAYDWLWISDVPLFSLTAWLLWKWWPRQASPPILRVLFVGFAWLPLALALYALQSLWFAIDGNFILGRAPIHALSIGYFGSLLVAMVTRVSHGHSGRPLQLGRVGLWAFACVQIVAIVRVVAELASDPLDWQIVAGLGWMLAFTPWALRALWIYLTPRIDGKPG